MEIREGSKTAVVVGATGLIGWQIVKQLLGHRAYKKVIVIARRTTGITHPLLEEYLIDFEHLVEEAYDLITGDDLYIALGTTMAKAGNRQAFYRVDYKFVLLCAEIGHRKGMKQLLLVSAVGADSDSKIFYNRVKGEVEEEVLKMPYWAVHIFRPSLLLGSRREFRFLESLGKKMTRGITQVAGHKMGRYRPVEGHQVAQAMIRCGQKLERGVHFYDSDTLHKIATDV